jgi:serine/threonine-protein kinase HipA
MARPSKARSLTLWANGVRVGQWQVSARGTDSLVYDSNWAASGQGRPLSLSLPFALNNAPLAGLAVYNYFDNLLPDSDAIRRRLQARFHTLNSAAFELLAAIGRDCVGAIQLLPDGQQPQDVFSIQAHALPEADVAKLLRATAASPAAMGQHDALDDDFRISIAGAQEKTALLWHQGQWCRPLGATPTTHIFKLPLGLVGNRQADMRTSVENEWLCSKILQLFELPIAACEIAQFEEQKVLIVERFDRRLSEQGYWLRLPQEDFCQATGTPPGAKYETDGGPGLVDIARILQHSETREQDLRVLLKAQLLFWLMAATDGHAKNFLIFLLPGGRYRLTPLYDVLSAWPVTGHGANQLDANRLRLAMAVRGKNMHYRLKDIQRRHFNHTARLCGWGENMEGLITEVLDQVTRVLEAAQEMLPAGFPEEVFAAVRAGMLDAADRLARMPAE